MRRKFVAGNWKMNGSHAANAELLAGISAARPFGCDVAVCVPFPYLSEAAVALAGSDVRWGAQDCSVHAAGAYTGEVSAGMLAEFGCRFAIVGHSERRAYHGESDQLVADKATKRAFDPKKGVAAKCVSFAEDEGVILRAVPGETVSVCPPLIITAAQIDELFDKYARALDRTLDWARKENLFAA